MYYRVSVQLTLIVASALSTTVLAAQSHPIEGDPYKLWGHRLVFTNWHYVRQGGVGWVNDKGARIGLYDDAAPGALRFEPSNGTMPRGIRLMAQQAEQRGPIIDSEMPWEAWDVVIVSLLTRRGAARRPRKNMHRGGSTSLATLSPQTAITGTVPSWEFENSTEVDKTIYWARMPITRSKAPFLSTLSLRRKSATNW